MVGYVHNSRKLDSGRMSVTDEQLAEYEVMATDKGLDYDHSMDLINEVRRLSQLDRVCRDAIVELDDNGRFCWGIKAWGQEDGDGPAYGHKIEAIGILLERYDERGSHKVR